MTSFLICSQLVQHPLTELHYLSNLLQMLNDHRMVDVDFFDILCSCKRISFNDDSQLVTANFQWPATMLFIFKVLVFFAKFLEPPLPCRFVSSYWAKCVADVVSCNSNKKIAQICFLYNIISIIENKHKINSK